MLVAAMTAFSFTSCEDVPAAYGIPDGGNGGNGDPTETVGNGTVENPYTVEDIKKAGATGSNVYVKAYIVGFVPDKSIDEAKFTAEGCEATSNVLIAASADETTVDNVMPVQLPAGDVRNAVNLKENPTNLKQEVVLCGNVETYFGKQGLKSVVWAKLGDKEFGTKPGDTPSTPTGEAKGAGTKDDPFNSVAATVEASKLAANAKSEQGYYIKGKVVSVKETFSAQYGNASFYISDDGQAGGQFLVYRSLYLGNKKWAEGQPNIQAGDEVVVYGKLTNYKGNTPETVQGDTYLVSLNGKTEAEGGSTGGGEDKPSTGGSTGGTTDGTVATNGDFESWTDGKPDNWKPACTAGNATLSQSTDAHSGTYAVKVGGTSSNKRLAYKELNLKAGEYTMSFYAKAASATAASICPGYVKVVNGAVDGSYVYGSYTNDIKDSEWVLVTHTFTLDADCTICLVVMNSKKTGSDVLIDDFKLVSGSEVILK